jgi:LPXTG-motif cell wall-anchored protein
MRRSKYRRASQSRMPSWLTGRRRIIAAVATLVAFGGIVTVTQVSNASTTKTQKKALSACDNIATPPKAKLSTKTRPGTYTTNNGRVTQHADDGAGDVPSTEALRQRCRNWVMTNVGGKNNSGGNGGGQGAATSAPAAGGGNNGGANNGGNNGGANNGGANNGGANNGGANNGGNNGGGAATQPTGGATASPPPGAGLGVLANSCANSKLAPHDGFQKGDRCVSTAFGEVGSAANNPSLLITNAPTNVTVNTPFTLKVSTRNLIRDRFLAAGAGGYYVESSVLKDGIERGHFHTECRMLPSTNEAPDPSPVPAFFVATEDTKGGRTPDTVTIQVPGMPTTGTAQCASWAGDGSHRIPMMERANQLPAIDSVRVIVKGAGNTGAGNNGAGNGNGGGGNTGTGGNNNGGGGNNGGGNGGQGNTGGNAGNGGNTGGGQGNTGGNAGNGGNTGGQGNTGGNGGNHNGQGNTGGQNGGQGNGATTSPTKAPPQGGNNGGSSTTAPTTKDDFTPGTAAPTTRSTAKPSHSHPSKSGTSGSTSDSTSGSTSDSASGSTKADEPEKSTRTESAADDSNTPDVSTTTKAAKPKASSSSAAPGNYAYSNDDGVPNSGVKAEDLKNLAEPPAAKKSGGPLARTGSNTMAFVGAGAVLLLVGLVVLAMTRRRRPSGNWQQ